MENEVKYFVTVLDYSTSGVDIWELPPYDEDENDDFGEFVAEYLVSELGYDIDFINWMVSEGFPKVYVDGIDKNSK